MQLYKNIQKQIGTKSLLKSFGYAYFIFIYLWRYSKVYIKPTSFYVYSHFTLKQDLQMCYIITDQLRRQDTNELHEGWLLHIYICVSKTYYSERSSFNLSIDFEGI